MENVKELVIKQLQMLGVEINELEDIDYYLSNAETLLKVHLKEDELPKGIENLMAELSAGLYLTSALLKSEKNNGSIVSIKEGNVSFTYSGGKSIWDLSQEMCHLTDYKLAPFRRIKW